MEAVVVKSYLWLLLKLKDIKGVLPLSASMAEIKMALVPEMLW